jgi:hypothetical protein
MVTFRSDPTIGEDVVSGSTRFVTNNVLRGATVNPLVGGGYEFLMGTADFTINEILDEFDPALSINWAIPAFTPPRSEDRERFGPMEMELITLAPASWRDVRG